MFEAIQPSLSDLLKDARDGKLQLPDFQRGWVWEEDGIQSLIVSIARSFPVGAMLTLKTGGGVKLKPRPIEGAPVEAERREPEELLLDGQQRTTSLYQAVMRAEPVDTKTAKGKKHRVFFYFNIDKCLQDPMPEEAVEIIDDTRLVTKNFGRDVVMDLSTPRGEFEHMRFPVHLVFAPNEWFNGWMEHWQFDQAKIRLFQQFQNKVIKAFEGYKVPLIRLERETSREAVCLVFEKVNTGGKKLDAFELLTAMFAAVGKVNLRNDWYGEKGAADTGRASRLAQFDVLKGIERTDFLRAISLAHTFELRRAAEINGKLGKELPAVSCNHGALLAIPVEAYLKWAQPVTDGFLNAARFIHAHGIYWWKDVPYPSQLTAFAALQATRDNKPLTAAERARITRWYWSGVFGELYGSSTETRIANDVEDLTKWLADGAAEPRNVASASFQESRLDTLYTRISAAYKGVNALLMSRGATDFLTAERIQVGNYFSENFDIHHIFPRAWCTRKENAIPAKRYDSVVNKTMISARTNKIIGGSAPSGYCEKLNKAVSDAGAELDSIMRGHMIDPVHLRANAFDAFYAARKEKLLQLIEDAMGKGALRDGTGDSEDYDTEVEVEFAAAALIPAENGESSDAEPEG